MNLGALVSETRNPATMGLDEMSTLEMVRCFNQEDRKVPEAIEKVLPAIAQAVDLAAAALKAGGRLIYLGAGTSGRLGVLDASECPPTFGVPHGVVVGLIAGGPGALLKAVEGAEDDEALGEADLRALNLTAVDMVVGLAASGRTPYVIGALRYARRLGCPTAAISCNPDSPIAHEAQVAISPVVGPEADRLDAPEIRHCAEAGAQHAVDWRDGQAGQGLPEPDGGREGHQRQTGGSRLPHRGGGDRRRTRSGGGSAGADRLRSQTGDPDDFSRRQRCRGAAAAAAARRLPARGAGALIHGGGGDGQDNGIGDTDPGGRGGEGNILKLENCMTRVRVEVSDEQRLDLAALRQLPGVKGYIKQGEQHQFIVGPGAAAKVVDAMRELLGGSAQPVVAVGDAARTKVQAKQNTLRR